ncbi:MAG: Trk system potassium transporter TrkA [Thermodesulfobacteriota bacterium]
MRVIIIGAGVVGYTIAKKFSSEGQDVVLIEKDEKRIQEVKEGLDVRVIHGSGSSPQVLMDAGIDKAEIVIAVTDSDEVNMIACLIAGTQSRVPKKIARIRDRDYMSYTTIFEEDYIDLDLNINPEKVAAERILKIMAIPGAVDVVDFADGRLKLVGYRLTASSPLAGKSLEKFTKLNPGKNFLIVAVYRGSDTIIPQGHTRFAAGDLVFTITAAEEAKGVVTLLRGEEVRTGNRVLIVGGGDVGYYLAEQTETGGYQSKVVEKNEARCAFLAEKLDKTIVIKGDGTDQDLLREENISDTDTFIAVTDDEEANILSSLLAKRLGAERCITLIDKQEYLSMVSTVGIDVAVSPRLCSVSDILQFVRRGKVLSVKTLMEGRVEAIESLAMETSDIVNRPIGKIKFPKGAIIGAVVKDDVVSLARGDTVIKPGDKVVIFALRKTIPKVEKALMVKPEYF